MRIVKVSGAAVYVVAWGFSCLLMSPNLAAMQIPQEAIAGPDGSDERQLRDSLLQAWAAYEARAKRWTNQLQRWRVYEDGILRSESVSSLKRNARCVSGEGGYVFHRNPAQPRGQEVVCINPDYAFKLARRDAKGAWALIEVIPASKREAYERFCREVGAPSAYPGNRLIEPQGLPGPPPTERVSSLNYTVRAVALDCLDPDALCVLIENRPNGDSNDLLKQNVQERKLRILLVLDPKHYYCIKRAEYQRETVSRAGSTTTETGKISMQYRITADGMPVPIRESRQGQIHVSAKDERAARVLNFAEEIEYQIDKNQPPAPDSDFSLTYYGLPEPLGLSWPRPVPWWLYILLAGMILAAMGLDIHAWRRHRRTAFA